MVKVKIGQKIPNFSATINNDKVFSLSNNIGKNIVIYFYPKDNTPGCTKEGEEFRDQFEAFSSNNAVIIGVSRDSIKSHEKFTCKFNFPFDLISDEDEAVCHLFDVIKEKNMYGRKYMGIERSTFLIDSDGTLVKEWRKVKVKGHVKEVLDAVRNI
ncbi:MAG: peroxiredoxin [Gammaproteobacteria bacterium]|nr:peroxiredoxin [Gammaproteobacteria bacterium]|tara:strand:- start:5515 stop:5982 length:468 start_codon:yes stop_codon:yes gene_type:complete